MNDIEKVCCEEHPRATIYDDDDTGELICTECGLVIQTRFSFESDNGYSNPNENLSLNKTFNSTTTIAPHIKFKYSYGKINKLTKHETMINMAKFALDRYSVELRCSNAAVDRAMILFKKSLKAINFKPKSVSAVAAASLYASCKEYSESRTLKEIVNAGDELSISMLNNALNAMLDYGVSSNSELDLQTSEIIPRFCFQLGLSSKVADVAIHLTEKALRISSCTTRSPVSMAAVAIYMVSQTTINPKTRKEVSKVTGASELTIKKIFRLLYPHKNEILPDDYIPQVQLRENLRK